MLLKNFKIFLKEVENQFGRKIKRIRSDRGREYESSAFNSFVQSLGIMKLLHHIHLLLMVWLKEKIEL